MPTLLAPASLADETLKARIRQMAKEVGVEGFLRQEEAIIGRADSREGLRSFQEPVLMAVGESDALTPPDLAREIASLSPHAKLSVIEGAGHMAPMERPQAVTRTLLDFLSAPESQLVAGPKT